MSNTATTIKIAREVPFGLIEFEERPPDKTGKQYRRYHVTVNGERKHVPSVTTILNVLDKPALGRWKERITAQSAATFAQTGGFDGIDPTTAHDVMREHGADSASVSRAAAQRGIDVHAVLERYAISGDVPNLTDFPVEQRGYVRGLVRWIVDDDPQPEAIEQLVAHPRDRYAGRFDLRARLRGAGSCLVDLKTNREGRIYREAHLQALAYALADVECGADPPDDIVLVGVGADGSYERVRCVAKPADWQCIIATRNRLTALDISLRELRKAAS